MSEMRPEDVVGSGSAATIPPSPVNGDQSAATLPDAGIDPVTGLHRMSTTAGVGSQEYVAINAAAIVALLLGFGSLLALMDNLLLIIPLAGVVVGIVALRQIRDSNGTQTGRGLALGGVVLSVLIAGGILATQLATHLRNQADENAIRKVMAEFAQDMKENKYDEGYALFSDHFHDRVSKDQFTEMMRGRQSSKYGPGQIVGADWNGLMLFTSDPDSGTVSAEGMMKIRYERLPADNEVRYGTAFRKQVDQWKIDDIPEFFPSTKAAARGQAQ